MTVPTITADFSGLIVLVNAIFPIRSQRYAATDSRNRFAQNLIIELCSLIKNMTAWCLTLQSYCTSVFTLFGRMASDIIPVMRTTLRQYLERHPSESLRRPA